jgi:hypothetical protein
VFIHRPTLRILQQQQRRSQPPIRVLLSLELLQLALAESPAAINGAVFVAYQHSGFFHSVSLSDDVCSGSTRRRRSRLQPL